MNNNLSFKKIRECQNDELNELIHINETDEDQMIANATLTLSHYQL